MPSNRGKIVWCVLDYDKNSRQSLALFESLLFGAIACTLIFSTVPVAWTFTFFSITYIGSVRDKISSLQNDKNKEIYDKYVIYKFKKIYEYNLWDFLELVESFLRFFFSNANPRVSQLILGFIIDSFKS